MSAHGAAMGSDQYVIRLTAHSGRGLLAMDRNGLSDPYLKVRVGGGGQLKTHYVRKTLNPDWEDESLVLPIQSLDDHVFVEVWDYDHLSTDDFMGDLQPIPVLSTPWWRTPAELHRIEATVFFPSYSASTSSSSSSSSSSASSSPPQSPSSSSASAVSTSHLRLPTADADQSNRHPASRGDLGAGVVVVSICREPMMPATTLLVSPVCLVGDGADRLDDVSVTVKLVDVASGRTAARQQIGGGVYSADSGAVLWPDKRDYRGSFQIEPHMYRHRIVARVSASVERRRVDVGHQSYSLLECAENLTLELRPLCKRLKGSRTRSQHQFIELRGAGGAVHRSNFALQLRCAASGYRSPEIKPFNLGAQKKVVKIVLDADVELFDRLAIGGMTKAACVTQRTTALELRNELIKTVAKTLQPDERNDFLSQCSTFFLHEVSTDGSKQIRMLRSGERVWQWVAWNTTSNLVFKDTASAGTSAGALAAGTSMLSMSDHHHQQQQQQQQHLEGVFGVPIDQVAVVSGRQQLVPSVVDDCIAALLPHVGVSGLFRVPGAASHVDQLMAAYDRSGSADVSGAAVEDVASLLMRFFMELPEPLFPARLYDKALRCAAATTLDSAAALIDWLPPVNQLVARRLFRFLAAVAAHCDANKMPAANLAVCWTPVLLRAEGDDPMLLLADGRKLNALVEFLVANAERLFMSVRRLDSLQSYYCEQEAIGDMYVVADRCGALSLLRALDPDVLGPWPTTADNSAPPRDPDAAVFALRSCAHANLLPLHIVYQTDACYYPIYAHTEGLFLDILVGAVGSYRETEVISFVRQLLSAVAYLHGHGHCHREIQPSNIYCSVVAAASLRPPSLSAADAQHKRNTLVLKLAGGCQVNRALNVGYCDPDARFAAPEVLAAATATVASRCSDLWSVGCFAYLLLTGRFPFDADSRSELVDIVVNPSRPLAFDTPDFRALPADAQSFVAQLLVRDPFKRPSSLDALRHPWIAQLKKESSLNDLMPAQINLKGTLDLRSMLERRRPPARKPAI